MEEEGKSSARSRQRKSPLSLHINIRAMTLRLLLRRHPNIRSHVRHRSGYERSARLHHAKLNMQHTPINPYARPARLRRRTAGGAICRMWSGQSRKLELMKMTTGATIEKGSYVTGLVCRWTRKTPSSKIGPYRAFFLRRIRLDGARSPRSSENRDSRSCRFRSCVTLRREYSSSSRPARKARCSRLRIPREIKAWSAATALKIQNQSRDAGGSASWQLIKVTYMLMRWKRAPRLLTHRGLLHHDERWTGLFSAQLR